MAWNTLAKTDAEVRGKTSGTLRVSDLDVLCTPESYMTDALINFGVTAWNDGHGAYTDLHNHVLWFSPALVAAAKDGSDEAFANSLGEALGQVGHLDAA